MWTNLCILFIIIIIFLWDIPLKSSAQVSLFCILVLFIFFQLLQLMGVETQSSLQKGKGRLQTWEEEVSPRKWNEWHTQRFIP